MEKWLESFKNQIILATSAMVLGPLITFFSFRSNQQNYSSIQGYLTGQWITKEVRDKGIRELRNMETQVDIWAGVAAIVAVNIIIFIIIIIKHTDDILDVFVHGKGHVPYEGQEIHNKQSQRKSKNKDQLQQQLQNGKKLNKNIQENEEENVVVRKNKVNHKKTQEESKIQENGYADDHDNEYNERFVEESKVQKDYSEEIKRKKRKHKKKKRY